MSASEGSSGSSATGAGAGESPALIPTEKKKEKSRVSKTSQILWHAHHNDANAVKKLLEEDRTLVQARDYDNRTPLHVAALHGWIDVAKCLIDYGADVNAQDRWRNTVKIVHFCLLYYTLCVYMELMIGGKTVIWSKTL